MSLNKILIVLACLGLAGCSSSKSTRDTEAPPYHLGAFEDFDPDEVGDVEPPPEHAGVAHDIPNQLEKKVGTAPRNIRGYRVQVFSSLDRSEANSVMERAIAWWVNRNKSDAEHPPVYLNYEQPFYKVRMGNFASREAARIELDRISRAFTGAFLVPAIISRR